MTAAFREVRAREHEGKARAALVAAIVPAAVVLAHAADGSAPALLDAATLVAPGKVERVRGGRKVLVAAAEAAEDSFRWHAARAEGQRRRFETLSHCGEGAVGVRCGACGSAQAAVLGCDNRRLCVSCRDSSANDRRARFARARGRLLHEAAKGGLLRRARTGGRYTEKHLTLTVPDGWIVGEGAVVSVKNARMCSRSVRLLDDISANSTIHFPVTFRSASLSMLPSSFPYQSPPRMRANVVLPCPPSPLSAMSSVVSIWHPGRSARATAPMSHFSEMVSM
jgi:hypothetical protein